MKIKNVKPGDIIRKKLNKHKNENSFNIFRDEQWKVMKVYENLVLAHSVKCPQIRRCFSYGDLVVLGLEMQHINK